MLDKSLSECGLDSVELAVHDVWRLWAEFGAASPRVDIVAREGFVVVKPGGHIEVGEAAVWGMVGKMCLKGGIERGAARVILMLGLEYGGAKAESILRDGYGMCRGLVGDGARPWLDPGFTWDDHFWKCVRVSAMARNVQECGSRQLQRMILPVCLARWSWLERNVVLPWRDIVGDLWS
jgi:hypothetical protein